MTGPRAGTRPVSDDNPAAWQASGQTSSPDADPLTEAGRWELFGGGGTLSDVFFVDGSYGWAAGTSVWKTTDGGTTWRRLPSLWGASLHRIVFADRNRGWALGDDNRVLRTEDGGETWMVSLSGSSRYYDPPLEYQPPNDLWTTGRYSPCCEDFDYLLHSTDGGRTWLDPGDPPDTTSNGIEALDFFDRAHGWSVGSGFWLAQGNYGRVLVKTLDAGGTWTYTSLTMVPSNAAIGGISLGSVTHGWLAADAALWRSTDGGDTWAEQHIFPAKLTWLHTEDTTRAWAQHGASLGAPQMAARTGSFSARPPPTGCFSEPRSRGGARRAAVLPRRPTAVERGSVIFTLPAARLQEWFWDALTGWRSASATIERTTDGGATWQAANSGLQGIDAFKFVDARNGWTWHNASLGLAHTTDGGATWQPQDTGSAALTDLQFVDAQHGWVRNDLQIRRTTDGGQSWHAIPAPAEPVPGRGDTPQLLFVDATRGWVSFHWSTGECTPGPSFDSRLSHTTDGGSTWGPPEPVRVDHVTFLERDRGFGWYWHCEDRNYAAWEISRTEDGGRTWKYVLWNDDSSGPWDLYAADPERLWMGDARYSSDGGLTWTGQRVEAPWYGVGTWFDRTSRAFGRVYEAAGALLWYRATEVTAHRAARPPQVDGNLADWAGVPAYVLNADRAYRVQGPAPVPLDASATLQAAWNAGNLYFAIRVYDDALKVDSGAKPWQDDAVEIGLDGRHDHVRNWALDDDRQFTVTALGQIYESGAPLSGVPVARTNTPNGYILEFAIPKARLGELGLAAKTIAGLNWALIDDDDGGNAEAKLEWTGAETRGQRLLGPVAVERAGSCLRRAGYTHPHQARPDHHADALAHARNPPARSRGRELGRRI